MKRRALLASLALAPWLARARQGRIQRIGFLGLTSPAAIASSLDGLRAGLREHGYVEGKTCVIEYRFAQGRYERLDALAVELAQLKVDVLLSQGTNGTRAAMRATTTIPIVMAGISDPVTTGLVKSIARPGVNVTGPMFFTQELSTKRLEFLNLALPHAKRLAVLVNPDNSSHPPIVRAMEANAAALGVELHRFEARGAGDLEAAFAAMASARVGGTVMVDDGSLNAQAAALVKVAEKQKLPLIGILEMVPAGGMMAYGVNRYEMFRRVAVYVDRILKGAKPEDMPIERIASYELVINKGAAARLGITIPQSLLIRADRVIQ